MFNENNIVKNLIKINGRNHQLTVAIEELSELQKEITKLIRNKGDFQNILEEVADVYIALETIQTVMGFYDGEIEDKISEKKKRTIERLINGDCK